MDYMIFNVHMNVNACDCTYGCMDTIRESALKVDCGRKIPCCTRESNLCQQHAGSTLYQLSYIFIHIRSKALRDCNYRNAGMHVCMCMCMCMCRCLNIFSFLLICLAQFYFGSMFYCTNACGLRDITNFPQEWASCWMVLKNKVLQWFWAI